ncbi:tudor domain-containing protein [Phthorimaea operculella]|nr:tudor domain-containing protein [Phthorimaea operculella]
METSPDILTVKLTNTEPYDIATMLAMTDYTTMGYGSNQISRFTTTDCEKHFYTHKELKANDILHVRLQAGKELNEFYAAEKKSYAQFLNERDSVTYFTKKLEKLAIEDFEVDKPVAVLMDSWYERAIIKEILSDSRVRVQLVDWGKIVEAHMSSIKPMNRFFYFPAAAIYCSVEQSQMADPGLQRYLYPGYEFLIEIQEVGNAFQKPNIVKILPLTSQKIYGHVRTRRV